MTQEVKREAEQLLRSGNRDGAIAYLQQTVNISLEDATLLVETLERGTGTSQPIGTDYSDTGEGLNPAVKTEIAEMIKTGRKAEAVKRVRESLGVGLGQALVMVEQVAREVDPNYVSFNLRGCAQTVARGVGIFLMIVSLMFLVAAAIIWFVQSQSIRKSDRVQGVVTQMTSNDTGGSAPVIEFNFKEKKRSYESTFYSSPPDYHIGETVFVFVNRDDPEDVSIDSFADRWAIIVGLSVPGAVILLISIVFIYLSKRKF